MARIYVRNSERPMTSENISLIKCAALGILIIILVISAGCLTKETAYVEAMNNKIVSCSHFSKITDDYQTPEGRYIVLEKYGKYLAKDIDLDLPGNLVGKYASCYSYVGCDLWNLTPLSENESGMRDACMVNP